MSTLAIIGVGPRGLFALENVLQQLESTGKLLNIKMFEPFKFPGAGPVWHLEQVDSNWVNITERGLGSLKGRPAIQYQNQTISSFPSYQEWANYDQSKTEPDSFPPRHKVGRYLNERFLSLLTILESSPNFELVISTVIKMELVNETVVVHTKNKTFICDESLVTIGHQPTKQDKQIESWHDHVTCNNDLQVFDEPYPISNFDNLKNKAYITIGLRGFGLAMIDVMRGLVINNFGNFKITDPSTFESIYYKSNIQNLKLVPFSLDGLPMVPKPLNEAIDSWYKPTDEELKYFETELKKHTHSKNDVQSFSFIITPIAKIISRIYNDLESKAYSHKLDDTHIESVVKIWLKDQDYDHVLIKDKNIDVYDLIDSYIKMALGEEQISLDFCIGQVWRQCQPTLYKSFSHSNLNDELIEDVIALDESTKRYSYGPPIESMQQILALVDANVLTLDYVNDPDIKQIESGWSIINKENESIIASTMINTVLDAPKLLEVNSSIITSLLNDDLIEPIHSKLGIETRNDAIVTSSLDNEFTPIAVLGRLSKGSVIGVDAILECFGNRVKDWAVAFVDRLD